MQAYLFPFPLSPLVPPTLDSFILKTNSFHLSSQLVLCFLPLHVSSRSKQAHPSPANATYTHTRNSSTSSCRNKLLKCHPRISLLLHNHAEVQQRYGTLSQPIKKSNAKARACRVGIALFAIVRAETEQEGALFMGRGEAEGDRQTETEQLSARKEGRKGDTLSSSAPLHLRLFDICFLSSSVHESIRHPLDVGRQLEVSFVLLHPLPPFRWVRGRFEHRAAGKWGFRMPGRKRNYISPDREMHAHSRQLPPPPPYPAATRRPTSQWPSFI